MIATQFEGRAVRALRRARRLTQNQLAAKAGVTSVSLCRLECGHTEPNVTTVARLADALDTTVDAFFHRGELAAV